MRRCGIYLLTVHLLVVIAVFSSSPSSFCLATNKDTLVNATRSPLKILGLFGHHGKSHFDLFKTLLEELARRGHHVTVISHFPRSESAKAKEPLPTYRDISLLDPKHGVYVEVIDLNAITHNFVRVANELLLLRLMADSACKSGLNHPDVKEFVRSNETFDVILTETFNTDCFLSIVHKFHAPYIGISSHQIMPWINVNLGNEDNPSYIPMIFLGLDKPMDLFSRILNTFVLSFVKGAYHYWFRYKDQAIANQAMGPDLPKLEDIAKQMQVLLVNTHNSLHGSVPFLPSVVEIGGMHVPSQTKPLPKDISEFLDNAHEGVLYFSLGSMIKMTTMPPEKLNAIFDVLGSIPRKVIWKWESEVLPRKLDNVMVKKWLPQFDVLNHPNIRCYMGHGGLLGVTESVYVGVPLVLIPMFGDQFHNSAAAKNRGVAEVIAFNNLNADSLRRALDKVFNDTSYSENARRLSQAFRDRPASPLETAVWWTEYIARGNGIPYLRSYGADLTWYQYYHIDVVLIAIIVIALLIYVTVRLAKLLIYVVRGSKTEKTSESKKRN